MKIYQVDAFTSEVFKGNPAAVCPLTNWLADEILLKIATENNLSETAFYVIKENNVEIRWFTPNTEVDLCGHATLATAFVLYYYENYQRDQIEFHSPRSGLLSVGIENRLFTLNFPEDEFSEVSLTHELLSTTDKKPIAAYKGKTDYMLIFENEEDISTMKPNLPGIAALHARGIIVTAKSKKYDFVSRFFAPAVGVNEDPVCGSAHTTLTPYWAAQLNKNELYAFQPSQRSGELYCKLLNKRIEIAGKAALYLKGEIFI
ncbi:PhzF family phenazine biosynthesis isomerase [Chryseobacterium sediminis]|uniref:PhzF family phenazine biosynthesis protein n=1 Tax=Chryseobacterium sediminis TaxID=1679494 RepID=UPI0028574F0D|nr:PhzF family phenazine biosynthesis isomerase [Chryseobacterium sediminis]MDR6466144.1 PhzF family phenazine biosynthesis protein [Chryseobacterium sediminis]